MLYGLKLRKIRLREQQKLDEYSLKKFKKITEYINISNLKYFEKEEALQQIMDIMLQLKDEQKSLDPIFDDYEDFCKSIIKEYTSDKNRVYIVLHYIQRITIYMLTMMFLGIIFFKIFYPKVNIELNIHSLLFGIGVAIFIKPLTHKNLKTTVFFVIYLLLLLLEFMIGLSLSLLKDSNGYDRI